MKKTLGTILLTTSIALLSTQTATAKPMTIKHSAVNNYTQKQYSLATFQRLGRVYSGVFEYTYYSQSVLPGGGLNIPGRHVNRDGYVADKDGYIVVASSLNGYPKGTVVNTPFGYKGKVYDKIGGNYNTKHIDVYTA